MTRYLVLWVNGGGIQNVGIFDAENPHGARVAACKEWHVVPDSALDMKTRPLSELHNGWSWYI